jgi:RNA polymerase sigma-70 factor (ECF subfamily)
MSLMVFALTEQSTNLPVQNLTEILDRCISGDLSAFRPLVEEYQGYAFAVAFRVLCDEEEARDVVQESFIRVWRNLSRYNRAVKFTTWMYSIVTHLCYDRLRSRKRRGAAAIDAVDPSLLASVAVEDNPERLFNNKELAGVITMLTEKLPPKQKIVFVLRDLQGLSVREVSDILQLSENSVKANLVYARKHLREQLKPLISE